MFGIFRRKSNMITSYLENQFHTASGQIWPALHGCLSSLRSLKCSRREEKRKVRILPQCFWTHWGRQSPWRGCEGRRLDPVSSNFPGSFFLLLLMTRPKPMTWSSFSTPRGGLGTTSWVPEGLPGAWSVSGKKMRSLWHPNQGSPLDPNQSRKPQICCCCRVGGGV